jgi:hypothetical protein
MILYRGSYHRLPAEQQAQVERMSIAQRGQVLWRKVLQEDKLKASRQQ